MTRVAIGLGSNLGESAGNVRAAIGALREIGEVLAVSRLYRSKPWGVTDQPEFVNAAVLLETPLAPSELLRWCKALEVRLGRRPGIRFGPRVIDLDILDYGGLRHREVDLELPHPRLLERAFALVPLAEIEPAFAGALAALPPSERAAVVALDAEQA